MQRLNSLEFFRTIFKVPLNYPPVLILTNSLKRKLSHGITYEISWFIESRAILLRKERIQLWD